MVACHLTRICQSGGDSKFWQDVPLEHKPDADDCQNDEDVFHGLSPFLVLHTRLWDHCPLFFEDTATQTHKQNCHAKSKMTAIYQNKKAG